MNIQWRKVESSNLEAIAYDADGKRLMIRFKSSPAAHYVYFKVEQSVVTQMLKAPSIGSFFAKEIKPAYEFEKVDG